MSTPARGASPAARACVGGGDGEPVFADRRLLDHDTARLAVLIHPSFLTEIGWDATFLVLSPPSDHALLGRPVCRADGCAVTAQQRSHVCAGCQRRLALAGLTVDQVALLDVRERRDRDVGPCLVAGCGRQWVSGPARLCRTHLDQRVELGLSMVGFLAHPSPSVSRNRCGEDHAGQARRHQFDPLGKLDHEPFDFHLFRDCTYTKRDS